jgi:hypothetical protein
MALHGARITAARPRAGANRPALGAYLTRTTARPAALVAAGRAGITTRKEARMNRLRQIRTLRIAFLSALVVLALGVSSSSTFAADVTTPFMGKAVNGGTVTHEMQGGKHFLTVSSDFVVPGSPDPHWQVIDTKGNAYLLDRLKLKDDKINRSITLPAYIPDVAKVQMWCAWAEVVLGEASFTQPIAMK